MRTRTSRSTGRASARPVVVSVFGTRPQLIKLAAMWKPLDAAFRSILIDSGQHYDFELAGVFYAGRRLRKPDLFLNARAKSPASQIAQIADRLDTFLSTRKPQAVMVYGDTSTTAGAVLAASYRNIPTAHVESGLRSFDQTASEEKNRIVADHLSTWRFCPTSTAIKNLRKEGIVDGVVGVGDVLYETFLMRTREPTESDLLMRLGLLKKQYYFFTCHRAETVDDSNRLLQVAEMLESLRSTVVFPVHPRTKRRLVDSGLWKRLRRIPDVRLIDPINHEDTIALIRSAQAVLTDSGGIQRESYWCKTPCLTLRDRTEWVELVACGANRVVGLNPMQVRRALRHPRPARKATDPFFSQRGVSRAIVTRLKRDLA